MMMDDLDRVLSSEDSLAPSSGFASSVMDAVHERAAAPNASPPFPWGRCLLGVGACVAWAFATVSLANGVDASTVSRFSSLAPHLGYAAAAIAAGLSPLYARKLLRR
jgi:hypothetical protein